MTSDSSNRSIADVEGKSPAKGAASKRLEEFFVFLADFKSIAGLTTKAGLPLPFADYWIKASPIWPAFPINALASSVTQLFALMAIFLMFWHRRGLRRTSLTASFLLSLIVMVVSALFYATLSRHYIVVDPKDNVPKVIGFRLIDKDLPDYLLDNGLSIQDVLKTQTIEQIWEGRSISEVHLSISISWMMLWASFTAGIGIFVLPNWMVSRSLPSPSRRPKGRAEANTGKS